MAIYSDLNQNKAYKKPYIEDLNSIYQSISNILRTEKGTRLFRPEFGSKISNILFELMDDLTVIKVQRYVAESIQKWEPRVRLIYGKTEIKADEDNNLLDIKLVFEVIGYEDQQFEHIETFDTFYNT